MASIRPIGDVLRVDRWLRGLEYGVASHHAGLVPLFKETVEDLFGDGLVKVVFATETLALGVNMPARSVVIEKLTKFTGTATTCSRPRSSRSSPAGPDGGASMRGAPP